MKKLVCIRITSQKSELEYLGIVICHTHNADINYNNVTPIKIEIYHNFLNNIVLGKLYKAELLNESPVRLQIIEEIKDEADMVILCNQIKGSSIN